MAINDVLKLLQTNWNIKPTDISLIKEGDSTKNWRVTVDNGEQYILRNAGLYQDYIKFQCSVLDYLKGKNFPYEIPEPIRLQNGNFIINIETGSFILYKYIKGDVIRSISISDSYKIGELLAIYHNYVSSFFWKGFGQLRSKDLLMHKKMTEFIVLSKESVEKKQLKSETDKEYLSKINHYTDFYLSKIKSIDQNFYNSLIKIPCHGDFEKRNIIKREGKIVGFIDLGGITIDPAVCDLQSSIQLNCLKNGQIDFQLAYGILQGYSKHIKINSKEIELIAPLMFSEMLKTLCWVLFERSGTNSRIDESEASDRLAVIDWIIPNYPRIF